MKLPQGVLAMSSGLLSFAPQGTIVFADGDFATWTFGSYTAGTGTATMVREATGGNPGARLNVTTVTATMADTTYGTGIKTDYSTTAQLEGTPFVLTLDVLSGPGTFGQGQDISLLVEQGGTVYARSRGVTNVQAAFARLSFSGTFSAASFTRVSGAGPATPNVGGGVTTRFGFGAGNTGSNTLTQYYNNVSLDLPPVVVPPPPSPPAANNPTLSQWALILLAGLLGLVAVGRLRMSDRKPFRTTGWRTQHRGPASTRLPESGAGKVEVRLDLSGRGGSLTAARSFEKSSLTPLSSVRESGGGSGV